ncbi:hypothetical protein HK102_003905 [Quaeritorhiza haematococci]|nr:hypothetical protein HK102_003905 [Quaeritorhiza haematococci]
MLQCHVKGCNANNFPLRIEEAEVETVEAEFNLNFMKRLLGKLDWPALILTAYSLGIDSLPQELPEDPDEKFLRKLHTVVMETKVKEGNMICNNCGHVYQIKDSIPNMLLQDNEV